MKVSEVAQSCPTICDPMDCSLPGSSVHGILQARILEWVAIPFSRGSSQLRDWTWVSLHCRRILLQGSFCYAESESEVAQSCPTLCDHMDCSLPDSSVHGIFQAILLEWMAISFSSGSSWPRDWTQVSCIVDRHFTVWATGEVLLVDGIVQSFDVFASFLDLSFTESRVLTSPVIIVNLSISLQFLLRVFWSSVFLVCPHLGSLWLLDGLIVLSLCNVLFVTCNFLCSKVCLKLIQPLLLFKIITCVTMIYPSRFFHFQIVS